MRPARRALGVALLAIVAGRAGAQESLDDIAGASSTPAGKTAEVNGYLADRFQYALINPLTTPVPTFDTPTILELLEANVQLKVNLGRKAFIYGDVSLILQGGWLFYTRDRDGNRVEYTDHDAASLRPSVVTSELYLSYSPLPWLNFVAGKKRVVWGSGLAFNPSDLINPPKDPTDPNFQRAGGWIARVELPFEKFTLSAVFSPQVLMQQSGLPYRFFAWPDYDRRDDQYHYLVAARLYALLYDTDVNLIYYFSNQFLDQFQNKSRVAFSLSRTVFTDYELHVEALFQMGSSRLYADHACVTGGYCPNPAAALAPTKLDRDTLYPRLLVGGRRTFSDESVLSLEYYYQGDGDSDLEFADRVRGLVTLSNLVTAGLISPAMLTERLNAASPAGLPQRFSFEPLRRHYLIASYTKPRIHDDWTLSMVLIAGLRDLSGLLSPSVSWNAREWLTLTLYGFFPIRGIPVGQAEVAGRSYSEYSLIPFDLRAMIEARIFY